MAEPTAVCYVLRSTAVFDGRLFTVNPSQVGAHRAPFADFLSDNIGNVCNASITKKSLLTSFNSLQKNIQRLHENQFWLAYITYSGV
ncbi:MAG: hypothetical protein ACXV8P_04345 [Methylobacter sp.]